MSLLLNLNVYIYSFLPLLILLLAFIHFLSYNLVPMHHFLLNVVSSPCSYHPYSPSPILTLISIPFISRQLLFHPSPLDSPLCIDIYISSFRSNLHFSLLHHLSPLLTSPQFFYVVLISSASYLSWSLLHIFLSSFVGWISCRESRGWSKSSCWSMDPDATGDRKSVV